MTDPPTFVTDLLQRQWLAQGVLEIKLRRPPAFAFLPGQFMRFHQGNDQRDYTLVSHPDGPTIDFCIAIVEGGRFSNDIAAAKIGASYRVSGPHGRFIYHESGQPAVFVATGTGIAPYVAFCRARKPKQTVLLHGVGSLDRLAYRDLLKGSVDHYIPCISSPFTGEEAYAGRVTDYLKHALKDGSYDFYLCGRSGMIRDATKVIDTRFAGSRLFIETYD